MNHSHPKPEPRAKRRLPGHALPTAPNQPCAIAARRLLLLVGAGADFPADGYDAVVGLGGAPLRGDHPRVRLKVGTGLRAIAKWGSWCVLLFPNADRFDVCGRTKAAKALYSELQGLAKADGGFETSLLSPSSVPSSPSATT